jgi:transcriptional antiterminator RfaH
MLTSVINEPSAAAESRWYAVQCLSHRESAASAHLRNQGFTVFLPQRQKTRRHARKLDTILVPFFPGYLFVSFRPGRDAWRCINGTYGVARIVTQGDAPLPVPHGVVEALQAECDDSGVLARSSELKPGQSVRLVAGAFADFVGELERLDDLGRVRVLLDIMGSRIPVLLAARDVVLGVDSL